jgi:hypothetical protein
MQQSDTRAIRLATEGFGDVGNPDASPVEVYMTVASARRSQGIRPQSVYIYKDQPRLDNFCI